ncbi:MAG TPA: CsbD family protein [Nitriliruptorales bacterium]|nr:CsbD family protein [Nitriliruptorales bacterium]
MADKDVDQKAEELKGRAKEAAGSLSGDRELQREGRADQIGADVKAKLDRFVERVKDALTRS